MKRLFTTLYLLSWAFLSYPLAFSSSSSGDWNNVTNWLTGIVPGTILPLEVQLISLDQISVEHNINVSSNLSLGGGATQELAVSETGNLTVDGNLTVPSGSDTQLKVIGLVSDIAEMTISGNLDLQGDVEITIQNGILTIEEDFLLADGINVKLHILSGGVLYVKKNSLFNGNIDICLDEEGTIIVDGNLDMSTIGGTPLDGNLVVLGNMVSTATFQAGDGIKLWGDYINSGSVTTDHRTDTGITGPAEGSYSDFAVLHTVLCIISDYCSANLGILPVQFTKALAKKSGKGVDIQWTTAQENGNDYFQIEKSEDGKLWVQVGSVKGAGNSSKQMDYEFTDYETTNSDITYYRIKQVDYNNEFSYSDIFYVESQILENKFNVGVYPNPNVGTFYFQLKETSEMVNSIYAITINGEVIDLLFDQNADLIKVYNNQKLAAGYYTLKIETEAGVGFSSFFVK